MMELKLRLPLVNEAAREAALSRQSRLTKPPGSLGRLEQLVVRMAAWQGSTVPQPRPAAVLLFAADHPVTRHDVSPYPSEVTRAMLANFATGGAAASVLSGFHRLPLSVVDVGVNGGAEALENLTPGTISSASCRRDPVAELAAGDIRVEDALDPRAFEACVEAGRRAVRGLSEPPRVLLLGEMGIGNTTTAAALAAALLRMNAEDMVGAGTGATGDRLCRKRLVVRDALARVGGERRPLELLRRLGGRDLSALFGALLEGLEAGAVILVDGFIVSTAVLTLHALEPQALDGMIFSHLSAEQGHRHLLAHLGVTPLLELGLCLGEGSGALLAFPLLEQACVLHARMATFDAAGVPNRDGAP